MKINSLKWLAAGALMTMSFGAAVPAATAAECIAPANPGGGWDFTCRQIGKIMFDIGAVDKPIQLQTCLVAVAVSPMATWSMSAIRMQT